MDQVKVWVADIVTLLTTLAKEVRSEVNEKTNVRASWYDMLFLIFKFVICFSVIKSGQSLEAIEKGQ